jgi:hypothetical protein
MKRKRLMTVVRKQAQPTKKKTQNPIKKPRLKARRRIIKLSRSAWVLFSSDKRLEVTTQFRENHATLSDDKVFGGVCKKLAHMWKSMSPEEKSYYFDLYKKDKLRYENELKNLGEEEIIMLRQHRRNRRNKKKLLPPNSKSAYMLFVKDQRSSVVADHPNLNFADVGRELGTRWNSMDVNQKHPYQQNAQLDRARYLQELEVFKLAKLEAKRLAKSEKEANLADKITILDVLHTNQLPLVPDMAREGTIAIV